MVFSRLLGQKDLAASRRVRNSMARHARDRSGNTPRLNLGAGHQVTCSKLIDKAMYESGWLVSAIDTYTDFLTYNLHRARFNSGDKIDRKNS